MEDGVRSSGMEHRLTSAVLAILILLSFPLSSCQRNRRKLIGVVPKGTSSIFWQSVQAGSVAASREFGVDILWNGPAQETDYTRQVEIVDSMITRHVDGLVVAATERSALNASLDRAAQAGIPVTVFDSGVDSDKYMTFVATNNYAAGQMGARKLIELIGGRGPVAMVMHAPGSFSTMERERGFDDLVSRNPAITVVGRQYSMSDRSKGMAATENILTAHPEVRGIFASSEPSSVGVAQALKARGLAGKIKLVAFDTSEGLVQDLKGGTIDALVAQDPFRIGYEGVRTIVDKWRGKTPPKRIDLDARVVTGPDLEKPEIQALLRPDLNKYLR